MTKVLSLRVPDELASWADEYAEQRGVTRQALLTEGLLSFKDDCERGVPEIRRARERQAANDLADAQVQGVGACPKRAPGLGHVWAGVKASGDSGNPCRFCGASGREFFAAAVKERSEVIGSVHTPMQSGTGGPAKAWGEKGMPPAMVAAAAAVVAEKKERDRVARESGVGRPGQLRSR